MSYQPLPEGARLYFRSSRRLATALHISASKQKCSRSAVSALQRRSGAIPHKVPCTENEVAAMGRSPIAANVVAILMRSSLHGLA